MLCFAVLAMVLGGLAASCVEGQEANSPPAIGAILLLEEEGKAGYLAMEEIRHGVTEPISAGGSQYIKSCMLSGGVAERLSTIQKNIKKGTRLVVSMGKANEEAMFQAQIRYPEVMFLLLNGEPRGENGVYEAKANSSCVSYKEEQAGFLAGYAAVKEGYRKLEFCGGSEEPEVSRYGHGFIQGADFAAGQLELAPETVQIRCCYAGEEGAADVKGHMTTWYQDGVQLVFACDSACVEVTESVISAAEEEGGKVIGAAVDWSGVSAVVLGSVTNNWSDAVQSAVDILGKHNGHWDAERAGQTIALGTAEQGVALVATDPAWRFQRFSMEDYQWIMEKLSKGEIILKEGSSRERFLATTRCRVFDMGEG